MKTTTPNTTSPADGLSAHEINQFHTQGFLGPYRALSNDQMAQVRQRIENEVLTSTGPNPMKHDSGSSWRL